MALVWYCLLHRYLKINEVLINILQEIKIKEIQLLKFVNLVMRVYTNNKIKYICSKLYKSHFNQVCRKYTYLYNRNKWNYLPVNIENSAWVNDFNKQMDLLREKSRYILDWKLFVGLQNLYFDYIFLIFRKFVKFFQKEMEAFYSFFFFSKK